MYVLLTYMMKVGFEAPLTGAKEEKSKGGGEVLLVSTPFAL